LLLLLCGDDGSCIAFGGIGCGDDDDVVCGGERHTLASRAHRDLDGAMTATSLRFPIISKTDPALAILAQSPFIATLELGEIPSPQYQKSKPKCSIANRLSLSQPLQGLLQLDQGAGPRWALLLHTP
jgi:hypothetical protein